MKITQQKINTLRSNDPVLRDLIDKVGRLKSFESETNHLKSASKIIVDQQISFKAAQSIWNKLDLIVETWSPETINALDFQTVRSAGLSAQKANYIKTLALSLATETFSFRHIPKLSDEAAIQELIKIKGFGRWSASMFLTFSLGREDTFAADDGGLKRAVMQLYHLDENEYLKEHEKISQKWMPYRSIASLYLWRWHDT